MGKYKELINPHLEAGQNELNTVIEGLKGNKIDARTVLDIIQRVSKRFDYISEMVNNE